MDHPHHSLFGLGLPGTKNFRTESLQTLLRQKPIDTPPGATVNSADLGAHVIVFQIHWQSQLIQPKYSHAGILETELEHPQEEDDLMNLILDVDEY